MNNILSRIIMQPIFHSYFDVLSRRDFDASRTLVQGLDFVTYPDVFGGWLMVRFHLGDQEVTIVDVKVGCHDGRVWVLNSHPVSCQIRLLL